MRSREMPALIRPQASLLFGYDRRPLLRLWRRKTLYSVHRKGRCCSTQWVRLILPTNRSGIVECDGTGGWNPSVSDISRESVRQRLEVRQPPNPNHR